MADDGKTQPQAETQATGAGSVLLLLSMVGILIVVKGGKN